MFSKILRANFGVFIGSRIKMKISLPTENFLNIFRLQLTSLCLLLRSFISFPTLREISIPGQGGKKILLSQLSAEVNPSDWKPVSSMSCAIKKSVNRLSTKILPILSISLRVLPTRISGPPSCQSRMIFIYVELGSPLEINRKKIIPTARLGIPSTSSSCYTEKKKCWAWSAVSNVSRGFFISNKARGLITRRTSGIFLSRLKPAWN